MKYWSLQAIRPCMVYLWLLSRQLATYEIGLMTLHFVCFTLFSFSHTLYSLVPYEWVAMSLILFGIKYWFSASSYFLIVCLSLADFFSLRQVIFFNTHTAHRTALAQLPRSYEHHATLNILRWWDMRKKYKAVKRFYLKSAEADGWFSRSCSAPRIWNCQIATNFKNFGNVPRNKITFKKCEKKYKKIRWPCWK